jgi:hypothetical protein
MTDGPHDAIGGIFELFQICTKQCFLSSLCAMGVHCSSVLDVRVEEETESGQESVLLLRELARRETCLLLRSKQFSGIVTLVPAGDAMQAVVLRATSRLENSFLSRVVAATSTCRPWEDYFHRSSGGTFGKQLQSLPVVPDVWARVVEEERARAGIEPPPVHEPDAEGTVDPSTFQPLSDVSAVCEEARTTFFDRCPVSVQNQPPDAWDQDQEDAWKALLREGPSLGLDQSETRTLASMARAREDALPPRQRQSRSVRKDAPKVPGGVVSKAEIAFLEASQKERQRRKKRSRNGTMASSGNDEKVHKNRPREIAPMISRRTQPTTELILGTFDENGRQTCSNANMRGKPVAVPSSLLQLPEGKCMESLESDYWDPKTPTPAYQPGRLNDFGSLLYAETANPIFSPRSALHAARRKQRGTRRDAQQVVKKQAAKDSSSLPHDVIPASGSWESYNAKLIERVCRLELDRKLPQVSHRDEGKYESILRFAIESSRMILNATQAGGICGSKFSNETVEKTAANNCEHAIKNMLSLSDVFMHSPGDDSTL